MYGPFKTYYAAAMNARMREKPGVPLTIYDIGRLVKTAHEKAMTPTNIIAGFKKTGVFPYDEDVFQESDFASSLVTDRPFEPENPEVTAGNAAEPATALPQSSASTVEPQTSGSNSDTVAQTPQTPQQYTSYSQTPQTNTASTPDSSTHFNSPQELFGYPQAAKRKKQRQSKRKKTAMILTDTPEKEFLQSLKKQQPNQNKLDQKQQKTAKKRLYSSRKNPNIDEVCEDSSDDGNDESIFCSTEKVNKCPDVDDYVLVEFPSQPVKYYVGQITRLKDEDGYFEIVYLRKKRHVAEFFFPEIPFIASVYEDDIKTVLPAPTECGSTSRQRSSVRFNCSFGLLNIH